MKILLYFEGESVISKSGIGRAFKHQQRALESAGIEFTTDPWCPDYDILHINTYYMNGWEDIEWDIRLFTVCDLKKEWMKLEDDEIEDSDLKLNLLSLHLPKFIWVATALNSGKEKKIFSLLFDATDLDNSNFFIYAVHYNIESFYITYINAQLAKEYNAKDEDNLYNYQSYKILSQHLDLKSKKILKPENNNSDTDKIISMLSSKIKKDHL